ncbi:MAG: hypothetical protein ACRERV_03180 [Methylococcales bacterium]
MGENLVREDRCQRSVIAIQACRQPAYFINIQNRSLTVVESVSREALVGKPGSAETGTMQGEAEFQTTTGVAQARRQRQIKYKLIHFSLAGRVRSRGYFILLHLLF